MFCFQCGKELPDGAKFCPSCGANQESVTNQAAPVQAEETKVESQPQPAAEPAKTEPAETPAEPVQPEATSEASAQPVQPEPAAEATAQPVQPEPVVEATAEPVQPQPVQPQTQTVPPSGTVQYTTVESPQPAQIGTKWLTVLPILLGIGAVMNLISIFQMLDELDGIPLSFAFSLPSIGPALAIAFFSTIVLIILAVATIILLIMRKKLGVFILYALYAIQILANVVVLFAYLDFGMDVLGLILSIIVGIAMLAINVVYFGKRKHLFS